MKIKCHILFCSMAFIMLLATYSYAQTFSENQVKGAFLYKITKFIRWNTPEKIVKLCFIGDKEDQQGQTLAITVAFMAGKDGSKFVIAPNVTMKEIKTCNMLFVGTRSEPNLQDILAIIDGKPIVTISDIDSFTRRGGMFGFSQKNDNISVELNFKKSKENNIDINSALQEMINLVE